jgi:hypothetical protein
MIEGNVSGEDLHKILHVLNKVPQALEIAAKDTAKTLLIAARGRTPVNKPGVKTRGQAKRGWGKLSKDPAGGYSFRNKVPYIGILEEGLYEHEGPRTVEQPGGKIFSKQAEEGILAPLLSNDPYISALGETIVAILLREIK